MPNRETIQATALAVARLGTFEWCLIDDTVVLDERSCEIFGLEPDERHHAEEVFDRIDPRDLGRVRKAVQKSTHARTRLEIEYRVVLPDGTRREIASLSDPLSAPDGTIERMVGAFLDITERAAARAALRESEARFRHMADSAPALIWMTDENGHVVFANMHYDYVFGRPASAMLGDGWRKVIHPDDLALFEAAYSSGFSEREPFRAEVRVIDRTNSVRWLRCEGVPRLNDGHQFLGYTGCNVDITEAKLAEERRDLLMHELNHRVKNTLATVQSLVRQSIRTTNDPEEAIKAVEGRLISLSLGHDILTREHWDGAWLRDVVSQALNPFQSTDGDRLKISGRRLRLSPQVTLALSMALHELATNAVKYGAWSNETGQVHVTWAVEHAPEGRRLTLTWKEQGGPLVQPPSRRGFGTRLLEHGLAQQLSEVNIDFSSQGVVCTIVVALGREAGYPSG